MARRVDPRAHLKLRGLKWYVQLSVPHALRPTIGASTLQRALKTSDLRSANEMKWSVLAEFRRLIERARRDPASFNGSPSALARAIGRGAAGLDEDTAAAVEVRVTDLAEKTGEQHGANEARRFASVAYGKPTIAEYAAECNRITEARATTQRMRVQAVTALTDYLGSASALLDEVTPEVALRFVDS